MHHAGTETGPTAVTSPSSVLLPNNDVSPDCDRSGSEPGILVGIIGRVRVDCGAQHTVVLWNKFDRRFRLGLRPSPGIKYFKIGNLERPGAVVAELGQKLVCARNRSADKGDVNYDSAT